MTRQRKRIAGFSLVELVAVMLVLGLLLAAALPRLDASRGVDELGFSQKVLTDLRIAQRRAQADGCEVRVTFTATGFRAEQRAALCSGPFSLPVAGVSGASSTLGGPAPPGMSLSAAPAVFYISASGAVLNAVGGLPVDVSIDTGLRVIQIVGTTGYASF